MNMNSKDVDDLNALSEVYAPTLNEGLTDRLRAKASGLKGSFQDLMGKAKAGFQGAVAGATGDVEGATAAAQRGQSQNQGQIAKINAYRKLANSKLERLADEIFQDLEKLNIVLPGMSSKSIGAFKGQLNRAFERVLAPLQPAAEEVEEDECKCGKPKGECECDLAEENAVLQHIVNHVAIRFPMIKSNEKFLMERIGTCYKQITDKPLSTQQIQSLKKLF